MQAVQIRSRNDVFQTLDALKRSRQKRRKSRAFFVEGVRNLNAARRYGWRFECFAYDASRQLSGWARDLMDGEAGAVRYALETGLMAELSDRENPSELAAVVSMREEDPYALKLSDPPLLAAFDRPSNRGNLGSVLRSCDAFGVDALLMTGHGVELYDPEVVLAGVGSLFAVPCCELEGPELERYIGWLRERYEDFQLVGTTSHHAVPLYEVDFTRPTLLMIGNEQTGMSARFREAVDVAATIPMAEDCFASSFNAACAATAVLYEAVRQRGGPAKR